MTLRNLLSCAFFLVLWLPVLEILELEWRFNEQYHYGYFVPIFTIYLLYLRFEDKPQPGRQKASKDPTVFLFLSALHLIPIQLIETANPDWRFIYWVATLLALLISCLWLYRWGGLSNLFHFAPALGMILFAVPWIIMIEKPMTSSLMEVVSVFTVEMLNLAGVYAVRMGNVIQLQNAVLGVEEACSGVRSLQSSLMAGYLFGELLRFRIPFRIILIFLGIVATFLLNLARTLTLTIVTLEHGNEGFEKWHDIIGNTIAIVGFVTVAALAYLISKFRWSRSGQTSNSPSPTRSGVQGLPSVDQYRTLPIASSIALIMILSLSHVADFYWYASSKNSSQSSFDYGNINWKQFSADVTEVEIAPIAKAQLKFSEGNHYAWLGNNNTLWSGFYFNWQSGNISSHAGVHRPENCLPATGMSLTQINETFNWTTPQGHEIPFQALTFTGLNRRTFVFFSVWDEGGDKPWVSIGWKDRFKDVWLRRLVHSRHSLQFLVDQATSYETAKDEFKIILQQMYDHSGS